MILQEFDECLQVIDDCLDQVNQQSEYPLYVKGLIRRQQGNIQESLRLFQQAACLNPLNVNNLKQVGRSLFLLGKQKAALQVFEEALRVGGGAYVDDWEIWHNKGLCLSYLKKPDEAKEAFLRANSIQRHDCTFMQLGQLFTQQEDYKGAIEVRVPPASAAPQHRHAPPACGTPAVGDRRAGPTDWRHRPCGPPLAR